MTQYGSSQFAEIYDRRWSTFAGRTAPMWHALLRHRVTATPQPVVLDVCCRTGQFAAYLLDQGCRVLAIDGSPPMLDRAKTNCARYVDSGRAEFFLSDVTDFMLPDPVDCAFSTYDSLNHLPNTAALRACFAAVYAAVKPGGFFAFSLKTQGGMQDWNSISVTEENACTMVTRGMVDDGGDYTNFQDTMSQRWFSPDDVIDLLDDTGWQDIYIADPADLSRRGITSIDSDRFFVVAGSPD